MERSPRPRERTRTNKDSKSPAGEMSSQVQVEGAVVVCAQLSAALALPSPLPALVPDSPSGGPDRPSCFSLGIFFPRPGGFGNWLMPVTAPIGIALLEGSGRAFLFLVPFFASIGWSPPSCLAIIIPCLPPSWLREHALALASATGINKAFEI